MPGPLPKPAGQRRRSNPATIPTTNLPCRGRTGPTPRSPIKLGAAGTAWWKWAWKTPQAAAWDVGNANFIARRANLEDKVASDDLKMELAVLREMRERDDRLGLTPKGRLALRWSIVDDTPASDEKPTLTAVPAAWRTAAAG